MSDIFKEVDDALKQEKVEEFWSRYGNLVIAAIIAIILGTGAYTTYSNWERSVNEEKTAIILEAQKNPEAFNVGKLEDLGADQKSLAQMFLAKNHLRNNESEEAFQVFETIRKNPGAGENLRGLAAYYARNMILNGKIEGNLSDVTLPGPSIWDNHFKIQDALYLGSQQKKPGEAIPLLDQVIASAAENQSLLQQAQQLKYVYEYDLEKEGQ